MAGTEVNQVNSAAEVSLIIGLGGSGLGQTATSRDVAVMSAFRLIATDLLHHGGGRKGPLAAVSNRSKAALLDYFVGEREHIRRDSQVKCFGGLQIDKQLELGQLHDR